MFFSGKRRRERLAEQPKPKPPKPIRVVWAEPTEGTNAGECPKCGRHFGRAVRAHSETCEAGEISARLNSR